MISRKAVRERLRRCVIRKPRRKGVLTECQLRALRILVLHGPLAPKGFAEYLWPADHPGWRRVGNCGQGSSRGVGMRLSAGGYLGKLLKLGWVEWAPERFGHLREFRVTREGLDVMRVAESQL